MTTAETKPPTIVRLRHTIEIIRQLGKLISLQPESKTLPEFLKAEVASRDTFQTELAAEFCAGLYGDYKRDDPSTGPALRPAAEAQATQ